MIRFLEDGELRFPALSLTMVRLPGLFYGEKAGSFSFGCQPCGALYLFRVHELDARRNDFLPVANPNCCIQQPACQPQPFRVITRKRSNFKEKASFLLG